MKNEKSASIQELRSKLIFPLNWASAESKKRMSVHSMDRFVSNAALQSASDNLI